MKPTETIVDARKMLFECLDQVRAGKLPAADMNAITNGVGKAISTYKLQLEILKLANQKPGADFLQIANGAPA